LVLNPCGSGLWSHRTAAYEVYLATLSLVGFSIMGS
jgi:hypothetical protein